jgi:hypothetical protein
MVNPVLMIWFWCLVMGFNVVCNGIILGINAVFNNEVLLVSYYEVVCLLFRGFASVWCGVRRIGYLL